MHTCRVPRPARQLHRAILGGDDHTIAAIPGYARAAIQAIYPSGKTRRYAARIRTRRAIAAEAP
jgi:hypothetical protein